MKKNDFSFESACVREVEVRRSTKAHVLPIFATSSFEFQTIDEGIELFQRVHDGHVYSRYANPTSESVAGKIAGLEAHGGNFETFGLMTSSGMSAITTLLSALLKSGDKILTQGNIYGGTTEWFQQILSKFDVTVDFADLNNISEVRSKLEADDRIRIIYCETPANPTLACVDLQALAAACRSNDRLSVIDNTFATPYLQQPLRLGIDFVIHSTTKYLNGHGNSIAGVIVGRTDGPHQQAIWQAMKLMGTNCSPFEAWLVHNGLKTLPLRMEKHSRNAMEIAQFLHQHSRIRETNYPGLSDHPQHAVAARQMRAFGGMLSFEVDGDLDCAIDVMNRVRFCKLTPTLGNVHTLILHPASMSHLNVPKALREAQGIGDNLIRLSVGIESAADIIADLDSALAAL